MTSARDEVLGRVRRAVADAGAPPEVSRTYRAEASVPAGNESWIDLFVERVQDYKATVHRCGPDEVEQLLGRLLDGPTVVPDGFLWAVPDPLADPAADSALTHEQLDAASAVVTTATLGIASTGTIVLTHAPGDRGEGQAHGRGQGRRAVSLVPDHHVCVLMENQVVPGVTDAIRRLDPSSPQTWISGPSATSDIELDRVEGVHGPRVLDVVLVVGGTA